jgi:hypothetical protein
MRPRAAVLAIICALPLTASLAAATELTETQLQIRPLGGEFWVADPDTGLAGFGSDGDLVRAALTAEEEPLAGRTIAFTTSDSRAICLATTNAHGAAECPYDLVLGALPFDDFNASFAGDAGFAPSAAKGRLGALHLTVRRAGNHSGACRVNEPGTTLDCTID